MAYAVLGSTGNCGTALLENLLRIPDTRIHAYCRNRNKLDRKLPKLAGHEKVVVFEGNIDDQDMLVECLRDTKAVFHCVTTNDNVPDCNIALHTAEQIVRALQRIKASTSGPTRLPKVVLLSSATIDDHLSREMPKLVRQILLTAGSRVYEDCKRAEDYLRAQDSWLTSIIMKPGGLAVDIQRGHKIDLDREESFVSYLDLAAAMIEAVDDAEGRYDMLNVSVVNVKGSAKFPSGTPMCILTNLLRHFFPFLHYYLPTTGPS